jgi:hypothetical protein
MSAHRRIRLLLYDFTCGQLEKPAHDEVQRHLHGCASCRRELDGLRQVLSFFPEGSPDPAVDCPPEFWAELLDAVNHELPPPAVRIPRFVRFGAFIDDITGPALRPSLVMGAFIVLVVSGIVAWQLLRHEPPQQVAETSVPQKTAAQTTAPPAVSSRPADTRVQNYLRKSRILLVGIANMPDRHDAPLDLKPEREASRALVREARYLRQQDIDPQSEALINDMDKVLIKLSNIREQTETPDLEIIRSGIERKNLLFKIRITETLYDRISDAGKQEKP